MQSAPLRDPAVYAIRNRVTGCVYIGGTVHYPNRFRSHRCDLRKGRHRNELLQRDWDHYGADAFDFVVLEEVRDESLLCEAEQRWMDQFQDRYNLCPLAGTPLGVVRRPEVRERMSASALRRPKRTLSEQHRARIAAAARGRKHSPETLEKMRAAHAARPVSRSA